MGLRLIGDARLPGAGDRLREALGKALHGAERAMPATLLCLSQSPCSPCIALHQHCPAPPAARTLQHVAGDLGASQLRLHLMRLAGAYVMECCESGELLECVAILFVAGRLACVLRPQRPAVRSAAPAGSGPISAEPTPLPSPRLRRRGRGNAAAPDPARNSQVRRANRWQSAALCLSVGNPF